MRQPRPAAVLQLCTSPCCRAGTLCFRRDPAAADQHAKQGIVDSIEGTPLQDRCVCKTSVPAACLASHIRAWTLNMLPVHCITSSCCRELLVNLLDECRIADAVYESELEAMCKLSCLKVSKACCPRKRRISRSLELASLSVRQAGRPYLITRCCRREMWSSICRRLTTFSQPSALRCGQPRNRSCWQCAARRACLMLSQTWQVGTAGVATLPAA